MSSKNSAKPAATAESLVEQAVEEKLVVPAQAEGETAVAEDVAAENTEAVDGPELKVIEGGKKSLKERFSEITAKLKQNQKTVLIVAGVVGSTAAVAFAKYAKKKAEEALDEEMSAENESELQAVKDESENA